MAPEFPIAASEQALRGDYLHITPLVLAVNACRAAGFYLATGESSRLPTPPVGIMVSPGQT